MEPSATTRMTGPYWPEPISILTVTEFPYGFVTIQAWGCDSGRHYSTTLPADEWAALGSAQELSPSFQANPIEFRLALEAERLRLAHSCDPLLAANNSRVDLVPHQIEAVYGVMLPQPTIRHLMAHDAGAGKTIMAGLLHKELRARQPGLRTLIVAPAALVPLWEREMREKFLEHFQLAERKDLSADPGMWLHHEQVITSMYFARLPDVQASLASVPWDLVIVDEAHHMAGYETHETLAYQLGRILSRQSRHLILATATPHKGDPENFLKLLQLLDPHIHDAAVVRQQPGGRRGSPLMWRRLKEEMVDFQGQPLFKPRVVETRWHCIAENPPELELYTALTQYVHKTYRAAERLGGRARTNVAFAMTMLQRRMASSFAALERSLLRRRDALLQRGPDWASIPAPIRVEDLPEAERWDAEQMIEAATAARTRKVREKEAAEIEGLLQKLDAVRRSGVETKVVALRKIMSLADVEPGNNEKLLVFTEFKDTLDSLRSMFESWGYTVTQIDGSMSRDQRLGAEKDFAERAQVMVATEAAGEGINLQFCARMINYDLPWVPTRLEQRMGRIHRYGQKRVARIYNLTAADTREGAVLVGLMDRLEEMKEDLGDRVFDVVSALVSDVNMEQLMAGVALSAPAEATQEQALRKLIDATRAGEERYRQWKEPVFLIDPRQFEHMRARSQRLRLTPEYAQHFLVDALQQWKEQPTAAAGSSAAPGDADILELCLVRKTVADALDVEAGQPILLSFHDSRCRENAGIQYVGLGTAFLDGALQLAQRHWGDSLSEGALFFDSQIPPGEAYLIWFARVPVFDGTGEVVEEVLFAIKQTPEAISAAASSSLIDLLPAVSGTEAPPAVLALGQDPQPAINWSVQKQQLPLLARVRQNRETIVGLRCQPMLDDAEAALRAAEKAYETCVFGGDGDLAEADRAVHKAGERLSRLRVQFEREAACSLGPTRIVGVAAVVSMHSEPTEDLVDARPEVEAGAVAKAQHYEKEHGRTAVDVSGEHRQYPYDLYSTGPGGPRCIEVKGTTTGRILLSENERRAAKRLGSSYYLYVVRDPLGPANLSIVRDPLAKMEHDAMLYSGVRYAYDATTWMTAAAGEETSL